MTAYDDEDLNDTDLVKNLRKQIEKAGKEKAEALAERDSALAVVRESTVKTTLAGLGASAKLAAYVPKDLEPTEEAVRGWLDEHADVFNFKAPAQQPAAVEQPQPQVADPATISEPPQDADAWSRIQNPESAAAPNIGSAHETWLASIAKESGGDVDKFASLFNAGFNPPT